MIGFDGQCQSNLDVSVSGSIVYSNCRGTKRRVVVEYVGPEKVDVEVAKQIVVLEKRGDQLPEQLRDEVFIHIGGLPEYVRREVQQVRVITGITNEQPATEQRVIELGVSSEDGFSQSKQIIMIGVSQKCDGVLRLTPDRGRNLLQCQLNRTRDITIVGKTDTIDTTLESTIEVIGAGGRVVKDTKQREVVIQGGSSPEIRKAAQDIVIQGKSISETETHLVGKIADRPSVDSMKSVIFGKGPAGDSIYGRIIEIAGGAGANIKEEKKYVEIGTGSSCENQLQVSLTGSTLSCLCDNRGIKVQYIGKGPTDLEIMHHSFIIEGSGGMPKFQNQDFLMIYIGGIPEKMKSQTKTVIVTEVFSQEESDSQRHQVIEMGGVKDVSNKNQRQVVLIGVSRKCDEMLEQKISGDKTQIWCTRVADRVGIASVHDSRNGDVEHEISTKEILLRGQSGSGDQAVEALNLVRETHEKVLLIGGVDDKEVILNNQVIKFGAGFNCKGSYDIVQEGNSFICKCVDSEETIKISYIGSSPTDVYISKKSELITNSAVDIQTSLNLYLGGKVNDILRERRVIEVIRNVTSRASKTLLKEIRFEGITNSRVHRLIEIGLTRNCNGRWDKLVERDAVYIICRKVEKRIAVSGGSGKPVLHERIVVQGQGHNGVNEMSQQETVVLQGRGEEREEPVYTRNNTVLIQGQGKTEVDTESRAETVVIRGSGRDQNFKTSVRNKTMVVHGKGVSRSRLESVQNDTIVIQGQGPEVTTKSTDKERVVLQGKGSDAAAESKQTESVVLQGQGPNRAQVSEVKRDRIIVQGKASDHVVESKQSESIVVQGQGPYEAPESHIQNETVLLQGQGAPEIQESEHEYERIIIQGKGYDSEVESREKKTFMLKGEGPYESLASERETERIVLQGKGSDHEETMQSETIIVQGQGGEKTSDRKTIIFQGGGTDTEGDNVQENKTIVISGLGALKKNNSIILQGGGKTENEIVVVQGQGPDEEEQMKENRTLVLQGKATDIVQEVAMKNKTVVIQGKDAELKESEVRKEINKTIVVKGEGPEVIKKVQDRIILTGVQEQVVEKLTSIKPDVFVENVTLIGNMEEVTAKTEYVQSTTESFTKSSYDVEEISLGGLMQSVKKESLDETSQFGNIPKDIVRIVLVGNREHININQSHRLIELGSKARCYDGIKVTAENRRLSVKCVGAETGLDINYIGKEDTNIEIKTHARLEEITEQQSKHDKVYIHLGGFKQNVKDVKSGVIVPIRKNVSAVNEKVVYIRGIKDGLTENFVQVVDIGIRQTGCKDNSFGQHTNEDGTVVFCRRRSDILPDEYDGELSRINVKEVENELVVLTGSQVDIRNDSSNGVINQVGIIDGEFIEGLSQPKEDLLFTVTSVNVSQGQTGTLDSSLVSRNENKTFSSTLLQVIDKDISETYTVDNTSEVDHGPSRGDLSIEDYEQDEARQNSASSSTYEKAFGSSTKQLNVEVNKTVDIKVGNDCTGKVEVFESDGQVIVKCTVGGDTFEINLVGLYHKSDEQITDKQVGTKSIKNGQRAIIIGDEVMLEAKQDITPNHLLIQEVEYASPKRYIGEKGSKSNISVRKMSLVESVRNHTSDNAESPEIEFIETATLSNHRRGDVPIDDSFSDDNDRPYGYQADSRNLHSTRYPYMRSSDRKWQNNIPSGIYETKKYGIDMKYIDGKYDDLSIRGFQHALSSDLKKEAQQNLNRAKYNIPSLKGSRLLKRIKTLKGSRSIHPFRDESNSPKNQHDKLPKRFSRFDANISGFKYTSQRLQSDTLIDSIRLRDARYKSNGHAIKSVSGSRSSLFDSLMINALNSGSAVHAYSNMSGSRRNNEVQSNSGLLSQTKLGSVRSEASPQFGNTQTGLSVDSNIKSDVLLGGLSSPNFGGGNSINLFHTGHLKGKKCFIL